jgi:heme exporter protein B
MTGFFALIARDVTLSLRAGGGAGIGIAFFALVALIFAFAVGADRALIARLAAPVVWTAALLATLVSLDRIFQADAEDGALDIMVETSESLTLAVLAKAIAHWLTSALPLLLATPLIAVLLNLPSQGYGPLLASLAVGTPALSLIGVLAAALTLSLKRSAVLAAVLAAPLLAPILIFGTGAAEAGLAGSASFTAVLMLQGAATLFALIVAPLAGAAAIRFNLS